MTGGVMLHGRWAALPRMAMAPLLAVILHDTQSSPATISYNYAVIYPKFKLRYIIMVILTCITVDTYKSAVLLVFSSPVD